MRRRSLPLELNLVEVIFMSVEYDVREYVCGFCGNIFDEASRTSRGEKHSRVTTQIVCPRCRNFLVTKSGKLLRVVKAKPKF